MASGENSTPSLPVWVCDKCLKTFPNPTSKKRHVREVCGRPEAERTCFDCNSTTPLVFASIPNYKRHVKTAHPGVATSVNNTAHPGAATSVKTSPPGPKIITTTSGQQAEAPPGSTIITTTFAEPTSTSVFGTMFRGFSQKGIPDQIADFEQAISSAGKQQAGLPSFLGNQRPRSSHVYALTLRQFLMIQLSDLSEFERTPPAANSLDSSLRLALIQLTSENATFIASHPALQGREAFLFPSSTFLANSSRISLVFHCSKFLDVSPSLSIRCQVYTCVCPPSLPPSLPL
jgi:hypothetical protein